MEFSEHKPIYLQMAEMIQEKILCHIWEEDSRIPSVRELGATLGVNPNTIVRTYQLLEAEEIIYNKRGLGYFVAPEGRDRILALRKEVFLRDELPEFFRQLKTLDIPLEEVGKMYRDYLQN